VATLWAKEPNDAEGSQRNPELSRTLWGDPSYELIGYLEDLMTIDVAAEDLEVSLGYQRVALGAN
jgi:hypothetical protein